MKPETAREIAERVAVDAIENSAMSTVLARVNFELLVTAIEAALDAERDRCAKIAESEADGCGASTQQECHLKIAAAIRGKD